MIEQQSTRSPGPKRPTLADVARRANVAPVTVSRALNTPDKVNKETLSRISEAVNALGFQVNPAARALAGSKWNTVGVVVPSLDHIMFQHHLGVFEAEMSAHNISLLISATNYDPEIEVKVVRDLVTRGVDAILLTHVDVPEETLALLDSVNMPRVLMGSHGRDHFPTWCGYDDRRAMHEIVDHLLALGHRRFGVLGDKRAVDNGRLRVDAVCERLAEAGLDLDEESIAWCGPDASEARQAFASIMKPDNSPTALICGNDDIALEALAVASNEGIRVPEDLAVTGFDDADVSSHPLIRLTTQRAAWRRLGQSAAEMILATIQGNTALPVLIPTELCVRHSTDPEAK